MFIFLISRCSSAAYYTCGFSDTQIYRGRHKYADTQICRHTDRQTQRCADTKIRRHLIYCHHSVQWALYRRFPTLGCYIFVIWS